METQDRFVEWFRSASPYVHAHRGQTFVVCFDGEILFSPLFPGLMHDIALLSSLGVRVVVVHGARPQIENSMQRADIEPIYSNGLRITDEPALVSVKEAVGRVRIEIEALLSTGVANTPMSETGIRVATGNFITARPLGIRAGVDLGFSGEVRRVDVEAVDRRLSRGEVVLISPLGYSPTGEVFSLRAMDLAEAVASQIAATKLILLMEGDGLSDAKGRPIRQLTQDEAQAHLNGLSSPDHGGRRELECALRACHGGVKRVHLIGQAVDGALLLELFTRDGIGTLISAMPFDQIRQATVDDITGIIELITPLEEQGMLVRRSREKLEIEIAHFTVLVRDGGVIGCAALYPYPEDSVAELACLVISPEYRDAGRAQDLFDHLTREATKQDLKSVFVLSTQATHWFLERGFAEARLEDLPVSRQSLYNYQRNSKVLIKQFG